MNTRILLAALAATTLLTACDGTPSAAREMPPPAERADAAAPDVATLLDDAIAGDHRSERNRARDEFRHPKETLQFFGLEPGMTVVELYPGAGWYTEILAPVLRENGRLIAAQFEDKAPPNYRPRVIAGYREMLSREPFDRVEMVTLDDSGRLQGVDDASVDLVLTFRNVHNWMTAGHLDKVFAEAARVLKTGGVFGVVEHRADEGADPMQSAERGYATEAFVIEQARAAGLELDARSDINANPADTKDYDIGVWALPPSRGGERSDEERARLDAIGESDRMTLRFVKR